MPQLLTAVASRCGARAVGRTDFSSCNTRAQLPLGTWNPPRPGMEPVSPDLAGRLLTSVLRHQEVPLFAF